MKDLSQFKDEEILTQTKALIATERRAHAEFLIYLAEVDARKLFLPEGYSSLFSFCTGALGLSEASASKRIQLARCSTKFPVVLGHIACNELTLSNASLLAPALTHENHRTLLDAALHKPKREVEKMMAAHFPKPDAPEKIRPLNATRTKFEFSADDEVVAMFRTLQARLRRKFPEGRMEDIVRETFHLLVRQTNPAREPSRKVAPRVTKHFRRSPANVARAVWKKDGERCTFVASNGKRCDGATFLELDHVIPRSLGGSSQDEKNLTVRCRAHNAWRGGAA